MLDPTGRSTSRQGSNDQSGTRHHVDEAHSLVPTEGITLSAASSATAAPVTAATNGKSDSLIAQMLGGTMGGAGGK